MDDIEGTLSALCDLAGLREQTTQAEYDPKRDAAWLTMRGHEVTVVRLPGEEPRWRLLTVTADTILTTVTWPTLGAEAILRAANALTAS